MFFHYFDYELLARLLLLLGYLIEVLILLMGKVSSGPHIE
jgi:hypothetical protein